MKVRPTRRPPAVLAAALSAAVSTALLSGCATGLNAATYQENTRQDTAYADVEGLSLRNLQVQAPTTPDRVLPIGGEAVVTGTLINRTGTEDRLREVTSELASSVTLTAGGQPATSVALPADGTMTEWTAVLSGLREQVRPGGFITVTLTFDRAGRTTVRVPVQSTGNDLENREVRQDPYELHHGGAGHTEDTSGEHAGEPAHEKADGHG